MRTMMLFWRSLFRLVIRLTMQEEKYGTRDRTYSAWHRRLSTRRFVGIDRAQLLAVIDLDASLYEEYDDRTQDYKPVTVTRRLAVRAGLPCYVLLYQSAPAPNPADPLWRDIAQFRVKRVWPKPEATWRTLEPGEWAKALLQIRTWAARRLDAEAANDPHYGGPQQYAGCG